MMPAAMRRLVEDIGEAVGASPEQFPETVTAALCAALRAGDWLAPERRRASHDNYTRHLLYADPDGRFSILSIVWAQGQASPVHGHHAWCAVEVYRGELTECSYREHANAAPELTTTIHRLAGTVSYDPAAGAVHRIANERPDMAITLHVYGADAGLLAAGVNRVLP